MKNSNFNWFWSQNCHIKPVEARQFLGGIMLAVGMSLIVPKIVAMQSASITFSAIYAASSIGVSFLGVAALCTALSIGARILSSHFDSSANFNMAEIVAQHGAKYNAKEISAELEKGVPEQECPRCRADQKSWTQVVGDKNNQIAR